MHLDLDQAIALAIFAAAAFDVETETPGVIAANARRWQLREKLANRRESSGVGDRIGARRAADRALVDDDGFVDLVEPAQLAVFARFLFRVVEMAEERAAQNIVDKGRLSTSGNTSDAGETA